jgi:transposase-like protein
MYSSPIMRRETEPKTLQEAIVYFSNPDNCLNYLIERRWPDGVVTCPRCGTDNVKFMASRRTWQCNARHPKAQFSIKVGTIFEDSPIGLDKWLAVMWMLANCKNGVSSWEIHRSVGVTQKSAWFMLQRVRLALQDDDAGMLSGHVEVDETFIGGKARFMHKSKRARVGTTGFVGKVAVMGLLERNGEVRCQIVPNTRRKNLESIIKQNIGTGTNVYSDNLPSYRQLDDAEYIHKVIDHAERYVDGQVHTNGIENFWSLLKRGLKGTYVSVEPFHLFRYLDEQSFRFNNRKANDAYRFDLAVSQIVGKRLTYAEVTGKDQDAREKSC